MRFTVFYLLFFLVKNVQSQNIFEESFNQLSAPINWQFSSKVESAVCLGTNNSNYIRFHPNFQDQSITTPNINVTQGNYVLLFDWNKARTLSVDSINVQFSNDNGNNWNTVYAIYNGNNRTWQTDSFLLDNISDSFKLRWNYFSSASFPSQYFNIDNIILKKNTATSIKNNRNNLFGSIYPNPSNGIVQLKLLNFKNQTGFIYVYNTQGELVFQNNLPTVSQSLLQLDLTTLSKGAYILKLETSEQSFSSTILIQ